jgi:hypothetical protein
MAIRRPTTCITNGLTNVNLESLIRQWKSLVKKHNKWNYHSADMYNLYPIFPLSVLVFKHQPTPHSFKWAHSKIFFCRNFICISVSQFRKKSWAGSLFVCFFFCCPKNSTYVINILPIIVCIIVFLNLDFLRSLFSNICFNVMFICQSVLPEIHDKIKWRKRSAAYRILNNSRS